MRKALLFCTLTCIYMTVNGQNVGINATGAAPDASAGLDINFTNKGLLAPRVALSATNAAGPIAAPATGLMVYNTATAGVVPNNVTPGYYYWTGAAWTRYMSGNEGWSVLGNTGTAIATNFLGTRDNVPLAIRTNNAERMRILNTGEVLVNATAGFATSTFYSAASGNDNAIDGNANGTGDAVYGQNIGTGSGVTGLSSNATGFGVTAINTNASGTGMLVIGNNAAGNYATAGSGGAFNGSRFGVYSVSSNTSTTISSAGVYGRDAGGGFTVLNGGSGVVGSAANSGVGVFATNSGTTNLAHGLYSSISSTTAVSVYGVGGSVALYGTTTVANGTGAYGNASSGNLSTGVYGEATNTGTSSVGVFGYAAAGSGTRYGGYFQNDMGTTGTKTFIIDHPADPANLILKHFSIESPEVLNVYRGNIVLDGNGEATVQMPDYFTLVNNTNMSYNLTPIGAPASLYIKTENTDGSFVIAGGTPGMKVSWTVYTERNDPYLQQFPEERQVVIKKEGDMAGKYYSPELYNQPASQGIYHKSIPVEPVKVTLPDARVDLKKAVKTVSE